VLLARKQNRKFESLVEEFVSEGRLSQAAAKRLLALEPFPQ
jgi:polyhydroxyalkanoate synthesis regulator phasin